MDDAQLYFSFRECGVYHFRESGQALDSGGKINPFFFTEVVKNGT